MFISTQSLFLFYVHIWFGFGLKLVSFFSMFTFDLILDTNSTSHGCWKETGMLYCYGVCICKFNSIWLDTSHPFFEKSNLIELISLSPSQFFQPNNIEMTYIYCSLIHLLNSLLNDMMLEFPYQIGKICTSRFRLKM